MSRAGKAVRRTIRLRRRPGLAKPASDLIDADQTSPVYPELRSLLLKTLGPEPLLRYALAEIDGIEEAFIYGSWADPSQRSPADIDVLVVGTPDIGAVYDAASAVETKVGRPVNIIVRSPAEWAEAEGVFERTVKSRPRIAPEMSILDELLSRGLIESIEIDPTTATKWLDDAVRHLNAAEKIVDLGPSGAYVLAYDAARKSVAATLLVAGYRVRSRPGSHQALAQYAELLTTQTGEQAFNRFDRLRRNRKRSEYGSRAFGKAEVAEAIETATAMRAASADLI